MNGTFFGDCRDTMRELISQGARAQCCVTSPPYYGLRDYGTASWEGGDGDCTHVGIDARTVSGGQGKQYTNEGSNRVFSGNCACGATREDRQIGLEATPAEYVAAMVEVFGLVRELLADDGVLWLNLGDSYATGGGSVGRSPGGGEQGDRFLRAGMIDTQPNRMPLPGLKPKDLIGIPWRVAFALQADGWYLRQDIIWAKPNPMPESVTDRCTKSHEYLFLLAKSERYYWDAKAIAEPAIYAGEQLGIVRGQKRRADSMGVSTSGNEKPGADANGGDTRNRRSVWTVSTQPYSGAHFAVFPAALIEPCILAGSRPGDVVLDPFMGSGTTAQVAQNLERRWIGCELNPAYGQLQEHRTAQGVLSLEA